MPVKSTYTLENFIKEANYVHSNKYDYSKTKFRVKSDKVTIICPTHGEFEQRVSHHIKGNGCPLCHFSEKRKGKQLFVEQANTLYKNRFEYDYSEVEYENTHTKVKIICKEHGEFWQSPRKHLSGMGCKGCLQKENNRKSKEAFIKKARAIHGDTYDYSLVEYKMPKQFFI